MPYLISKAPRPVSPGAQSNGDCYGPAFQCRVIHELPVPEEDFRGKPRSIEAANGIVAADNSRCSQIGADVLRVSE